jgi:hypothetical protein
MFKKFLVVALIGLVQLAALSPIKANASSKNSSLNLITKHLRSPAPADVKSGNVMPSRVLTLIATKQQPQTALSVNPNRQRAFWPGLPYNVVAPTKLVIGHTEQSPIANRETPSPPRLARAMKPYSPPVVLERPDWQERQEMAAPVPHLRHITLVALGKIKINPASLTINLKQRQPVRNHWTVEPRLPEPLAVSPVAHPTLSRQRAMIA